MEGTQCRLNECDTHDVTFPPPPEESDECGKQVKFDLMGYWESWCVKPSGHSGVHVDPEGITRRKHEDAIVMVLTGGAFLIVALVMFLVVYSLGWVQDA